MSEKSSDPKVKRRFYVIAFFVAFAIDYIYSAVLGTEFQPSLIGLAVMITSAMFFVFSLIRDR